jgi:hypothetical protein
MRLTREEAEGYLGKGIVKQLEDEKSLLSYTVIEKGKTIGTLYYTFRRFETGGEYYRVYRYLGVSFKTGIYSTWFEIKVECKTLSLKKLNKLNFGVIRHADI